MSENGQTHFENFAANDVRFSKFIWPFLRLSIKWFYLVWLPFVTFMKLFMKTLLCRFFREICNCLLQHLFKISYWNKWRQNFNPFQLGFIKNGQALKKKTSLTTTASISFSSWWSTKQLYNAIFPWKHTYFFMGAAR